MSKQTKILFLINDITMPGGLSRVTKNLVNDFAQFGNEFHVRALSAAAKYGKYHHSRVDYLEMPALHGLNAASKLVWYGSLRREVEYYVDSQEVDIVIAVGTAMNLFASFCKFKRASLWGAEHTAHNYFGPFRKLMKRWRYPKLQRLICLTYADKVHHYDKYLNRVVVIPNYTNFSEVESVYSNRHRFLFIGRYNKTKGVDYLADIIEKVHFACPSWLFDLYGEGEDKQWLQNRLTELNLDHIVEVNDPTNDVCHEYQKAGVFILTSRNEGFPMVLLEAQAHGLPIVSFDCETGPSEIITDGEDGYLVPAFDVETFAKRLIKLANDEVKRLDMSARAVKNRQRFGKDAILSLWLDQFRT
ncbi:glycosyltransferase family 4 protein [Vibrio sp. MarTm2]|uniref:glycosyltransferase family 4 protein n=1 Tax=Vibrio sp. MarTm2 TaxID=2998831 RepID=UPI0022CD6AF2|nr:glycosyltransferase family 4 protein [Vibrio sp. MarTm2]MDA0129864.1 glycosyltransferase family 4 protein [Vibrio sp. MarTm2]